jgi:hypothetical protein
MRRRENEVEGRERRGEMRKKEEERDSILARLFLLPYPIRVSRRPGFPGHVRVFTCLSGVRGDF